VEGDNHAALTFFTLAPIKDSYDEGADRELSTQCVQQLGELWTQHFGLSAQAKRLVSSIESGALVEVQRWPLEPYISDVQNPRTIEPHPYAVRALGTPDWDGRLIFAGTECDQSSPGVMEGAVGSALAALGLIKKLLQKS
jgi:hypothetical protein